MTATGSTQSGRVDPVFVEDPADPRLSPFTTMTDEALRRHRESPGGDLAGRFICEGYLVTERALSAGLMPEAVLVPSDQIRRLPEFPADTPVFTGSAELVESVTGYHIHRGFLALFRRPTTRSVADLLDDGRRLLVTENVTNPTNLGAIVRSAAALGMDGVLLDPTSCDPLYRRVVRVSMGAVFALPHARLDPLPDGLGVVREAGFRLIALSGDPGATPIDSLRMSERMALVLGAEGPGLSPDTLGVVDESVRIPMRAGIDSLNVAAAAAIAAYVIGDPEPS